MDYIFIIGPSAVGKTTLAKELYKHYKGVYIEQNMVPEFYIPNSVEDIGIYEEEICWNNVLLQLQFFYQKGLKNIIALDFDDVRVRELPQLFKGSKYIIIKLISSNSEQIRNQMIYRHNHEGGLYDLDNIVRSNEKIKNRKLLPNEVVIDIFRKTKEEVLKETINLIDHYQPLIDYYYELDAEKNYLSWVKSKNLK